MYVYMYAFCICKEPPVQEAYIYIYKVSVIRYDFAIFPSREGRGWGFPTLISLSTSHTVFCFAHGLDSASHHMST